MNGVVREAAGAREMTLVAAALATLITGVLWLADAGVLLSRPFWVDEWFTVLVAGRGSAADAIAHLRAGADGGASLYHALVALLRSITGTVTPVALRALSLVLAFATLLLVYAVLRRRFGRDASVAGMLAVGSHSLVVAHAFEGRFYALWLSCAALFAWALAAGDRAGRSHRVARYVAPVLLVTSHWYGIFTLGLMAAAAVLAHGRRWREGLRFVAPAATGLVALVAVLPLALGQRAAVSVDTWIPAFSAGQLRGLAAVFWGARVPLIAAVVILVAWLLGRPQRGGRPAGSGEPAGAEPAGVRRAVRAVLTEPSLAALLALAAFPLVLTVLSLAGLPSMIARYAIPAVLAWAPLVAFAAALVGRWPARVFALVLAGFLFVAVTREAARKNAFAIGVERERRTVLEAVQRGEPVVFQSLHTMYPALGPDLIMNPGRADARWRVGYLDLPDSTMDALFPRTSRWYQLNKGIRLERDFARVHSARFGFPPLAGQAALDTVARFYVVASAARLPRGADDITSLSRAAFPRHRVSQLTENLLLLELPDARSLPERSTSR